MKIKRLCSFMLILCISFLATQGQAFANIPQHTGNFYVNDFAGVLTPETTRHIVSSNESLYDKSGAQIVVTTVDFLDGMEIDDYAKQMFNQWGIGDAELNNGLLFLIVVGEDDYFVATGDGMDSIISEGQLDRILNTYLEPHFLEDIEEINYDEGVLNSFNAIYDRVDSFYPDNIENNINATPISYVDNNQTPTSSGSSTMFYIFLIIIFIMIIPAMSGGRRRRRGLGRSSMFWWLMPSPLRRNRRQNINTPPPAPRSNRSNPFSGGGGSSSGGTRRGGSRLGGGGRSSGGGVGRRK